MFSWEVLRVPVKRKFFVFFLTFKLHSMPSNLTNCVGDWQFACSFQAEPTAKRRSHLPLIRLTNYTTNRPQYGNFYFIFFLKVGFCVKGKSMNSRCGYCRAKVRKKKKKTFYFLATLQFPKFQSDNNTLTPTSLDMCMETLPVRADTSTVAFSKPLKRYSPQPEI